MPKAPATARSAALALLNGVLAERRLLSELLPALPVMRELPPPERAAAQRLATDTLRGMERADRVLKPHLRKAPPLSVRNILRLATVELCQGGAAHGVVNAAVALTAAGKRTQSYKGLVNAVLRKVAEEGTEHWNKLRIPRISRWLRDPLVAAWGAKPVAAMETVQFQAPPLDLTAKADPAAVAQATGGTLLPTGSVRLTDAGQVTALPGYDTGDWWVQDAAAALPARLLGNVAGQNVLDMCAAPGGKTLQLAAAGARVTALDASATRMARVEENLKRTGLSAQTVVGDALEHRAASDSLYDAILLDAPCSATGTMRRHPDLPLAKDGSGIGELIDLQSAMLDHALTLLAPGGRLVFCTCSLLPDEGECQIDAALERHGDLRVLAADAPGIDPDWRSSEGGLRLRPDFWADSGGMDGFYMAVLGRETAT